MSDQPPRDMTESAQEGTPGQTATAEQAARTLLREVAGLLADARRAMAADHMVSLTALENAVREACIAVRDLPSAQGRALLPHLEAIVYDLDTLATDLAARFGDLARRPGDAGGRPHPTMGAAYRPPPSPARQDQGEG